MKFKILLFLSALLFLCQCKTKNDVQTKATDLILLLNQEQKIDKNIFIVFTKIIEDSRCPKDANCIWQGQARVNVRILKNNQIHNFEIASNTINSAYKNSFEFDGKIYTFSSLKPEPGEAKTANKDKSELRLITN